MSLIIDEDEADRRVNSPDNLTVKLLEVRDLYKNRTGPKAIPEGLQRLGVAIAAQSTNKSAGQLLECTSENISYLKGKHQDVIASVHERALDSMLASIDCIKEKIPEVRKATDLSMIAANLARVVEKTSPRDSTTSSVKVVVFSPRIRDEREFEEQVVG